MPQDNLTILFVVNKVSGRKNTDWVKRIEEHFIGLPYVLQFFKMPLNNAADGLKASINAFKPQRVVAVGGDGTVTFVAKELIGKDIEMGILPAGSANGMARELGIAEDIKKALNIVMEGEVKEMDVIGLNDTEICLHLSDLGLNAQLVKHFDEGNTRGTLGYAMALVKTLYKKQRIKVTIQSKDKDVQRNAIMVIIANASKYGTGATINPLGNLYDGLFEVVIVTKIGIAEIFKMFTGFKRFNPQHIEVLSTRSAILETKHKAHFQIDGEYKGKVNKVYAKMLKGKLKLIVPKN